MNQKGKEKKKNVSLLQQKDVLQAEACLAIFPECLDFCQHHKDEQC